MITITRRQARQLRAVFRRSVLGIAHRGVIPPLVLMTDGTKLRAQHRYGALAVEHVQDAAPPTQGTIAVPLDMLSEIAGRDDSPVVLESTAPDRTRVRWQDAGIPQTREYEVTELAKLVPFTELPTRFVPAPAALVDALEEACRTAAEDSTRYALDCILLRGRAGQLAATDGRQLLITGGFELPWQDDILVHRTALFGCRELHSVQPIELGRTDAYVVLRIGSWTVFLEIQKEARFPRVDDVLPAPASASTRVEFDAEDARFLAESLDRLPGADESDAPVTLELNGRVVLRARAADGPATELVLSRSRYTGDPVCVATNRHYLARAMGLRFLCLEIATAKEPLVCRDEPRTYGWQPLTPGTAIESAEDTVCVNSASERAAEKPRKPERAKPAMNGSQSHESSTPKKPVGANGTTSDENSAATGLAALIRDAEALYQALGQAKSQTGKLLKALRRHRRQSRLVATTLASLRELQLQDAEQ